MRTPIALAVPGLDFEAQVIAGAAAHDMEIRRRCVDAADLLGACLGAPGLTAVITAGLPRLSADVSARLHAADSRVVGIAVRPDDRAHLEALGIDTIIESGNEPSELLPRLSEAIHGGEVRHGVWHVEGANTGGDAEPEAGRIIAVWGPAGAPGRTTTALVLAQSLAENSRTVIVDADTSAPSLALHLGLADDLSGLILACRHAETGSLSRRSVESALSRISDDLFALTGVSHWRRASELRSVALTRVYDRLRCDFSNVVADIGANLEDSSAVATLTAANAVVAVCRAEPLGVARFLAELPALADFGVPLVCVITGGSQGDQAQQLIREAARELGVSIPMADISLNPNILASALRKGLVVRPKWRSSRQFGGVSRLAELVA